MEVADLHGLAKAEVVDVDDQTFGNFGVAGSYFDFLHRKGELTTGFHTFGVAFDLHGYRHNHRLGFVNLEQVDVEDIVLNGVELHLAEHCGFLAAVIFEFDCENVGGIDELANGFVGDGEVGGDDAASVFYFHDFLSGVEGALVGEFEGFAAVENHGDFTFGTEMFRCFFAEIHAGFGRKLESFHFLK